MTPPSSPKISFFRRHWLSVFLVLSVLLHGLLLLVVSLLPGQVWNSATPQWISRYVDVFPDERQVVQSKEIDDGSNAKAKFRGEKRNRVAEETRNPRIGPPVKGGAPRQETLPEDSNGEPGPAKNLSLSDLSRLSRTPHRLDETIKQGDETVLNTDSYAFASFLNRISDAIYPAWVRHLREAATSLQMESNPSGLSGKSDFITRLGVEMDTRGNVVSVQVLKSSGVTEIDDAPRSAFWDKEPFHNPPSQLFAENEPTVRFVYEFHFQWKKSFFSISPSL